MKVQAVSFLFSLGQSILRGSYSGGVKKINLEQTFMLYFEKTALIESN